MKELNGLYGAVILIVITGIVLGIGIFVLSEVEDNTLPQQAGITTTSLSENFILDNSTSGILNQTPTTWVSATAKNRTWLNFDGVNDRVFIADDSYKTISYWVNDTSNNWIHVINTSGLLFENTNEVDSLTLTSFYKNTTGWFIGQNDSNDFFKGNIDSIRFYNDTISQTVINSLYQNGRE